MTSFFDFVSAAPDDGNDSSWDSGDGHDQDWDSGGDSEWDGQADIWDTGAG